jgi:hypothetical protein
MKGLTALSVRRWSLAMLSAVPLLVASAAWADPADGGWTRQFLKVSAFCANYAPFSGNVTGPGSTGGKIGAAAPGDTFTLVAGGPGTGTWRIVADPAGATTLTAGGVFPGTLVYEVPPGGTTTGVGFFVDTYVGNGTTITGSCVGPATGIPTLSAWAQIALVMLLSLFGFAAYRLRRSR